MASTKPAQRGYSATPTRGPLTHLATPLRRITYCSFCPCSQITRACNTARQQDKEDIPMLLPLAKEPFTAPTERDMLPSERRAFVRTHRTCVFGYRRLHDGPAMSVVYYIPTDSDELLVSTMAARGKARAVTRDDKVSLCVLDERWPFAYLQVYADAVIERDRDLAVDVMMAVAERMSGRKLGEEARPDIESMAVQ